MFGLPEKKKLLGLLTQAASGTDRRLFCETLRGSAAGGGGTPLTGNSHRRVSVPEQRALVCPLNTPPNECSARGSGWRRGYKVTFN